MFLSCWKKVLSTVRIAAVCGGSFLVVSGAWAATIDIGSFGFNNREGSEAAKQVLQDKVNVTKANVLGYSELVGPLLEVNGEQAYLLNSSLFLHGRSRANVYYMVTQYGENGQKVLPPQLFSDVKPVFSSEVWEPLAFGFKTKPEATHVRIHVIVTDAPVNISLKDMTLTPVEDEAIAYKPRYEAPVPEELPPLEPAIERLKQRPRAVAKRVVQNGRSRIVIDGKTVPPAFYATPANDNLFKAHVRDFAAAGVKVYAVSLKMGNGWFAGQSDGVWMGKNQFNWEELDRRLWRILRVDPDAYIVFYLNIDPYRNWPNENPDAIVRDQHGNKVVVRLHPTGWGREPQKQSSGYEERYGHSFVSPDLRRDTQNALTQMVHYVRNSLAGKAVVGYHLAGGSDGQFYHWSGYEPDKPRTPENYHLSDYSPDSQREFRAWLLRKYKNIEALRIAWNRPGLNLDQVTIPAGERRLSPGFFFDSKTDEDIADYNQFYAEGTVETLHGFARVVKQETENENLVSTYWEDSASASSLQSGHLATAKILQSEDIDFLTGPTGYGARMPGQEGRAQSVWGSLLLKNRLWLSEQDYRSWLVRSGGIANDKGWGRAGTAKEHNDMVRRESGMMLAFGQGTWWYDMNGGFFADRGIMQGIGEAVNGFKKDLDHNEFPRAELAVFISERSLQYLKHAPATGFKYKAVAEQIQELNRSGVPYQLYLQSDLTNPKLPEFKSYLFLNAHLVEPDEWKAIQTLKQKGKHLCFLHAPGIIKPENVGAATKEAAIQAITGLSVQYDGEGRTIDVKALNRDGYIAINKAQAPRWKIVDTGAEGIGAYEDGTLGAARKNKVTLIGGIKLQDTFINRFARESGAWVASAPGDAVFANQHFVTIHALYDGLKTIRLSQPGKVTDLTSGEVIATGAREIEVALKRGETRWFYINNAG